MVIFRGDRCGAIGFRRLCGAILAAMVAASASMCLVTGIGQSANVTPTSYHASATLTAAANSGDNTTYLGSNDRTAFDAAETAITSGTVGSLAEAWSTPSQGNSFVSSQVITSAGVAFWGDQEGYEHATDVASGQQVWLSPQLAVLPQSQLHCQGYVSQGITGAATVGQIGGQKVVYVADGQANEYALDASTGAIVWQTNLAPVPEMIWGSAALYNGSLYVGVASDGDCPLAQGQLVKLDAATGAVQATFDVVPNGCVGGGVWSSPTIDEADNAVYITTGNPDFSCGSSEPYAQAIVKLDATDLSYISSWQQSDGFADDFDFGATATLFTATIDGVARTLVGAVNKNGTYYALDRTNLAAGPIWTYQVSDPGPAPEQGSGSIAPSSFDGSNLYIGGGNLASCASELAALDPATGVPRWRDCTDGPIIGGVVTAPGLVVAAAGPYVDVFDATTGATLLHWNDGSSNWYFASPTISNGWILIPRSSGVLYGLTVPPPGAAAAAVGVEGSDGQLWAQAPQLAAGWQPLGGVIAAPPAVAAAASASSSTPADPLFIATGTDGTLWIRSLTDGWQPVGAAQCLGGPAAAITGSTLTVACRGTDNALWYNTANVLSSGLPAFTGSWKSLGGVLSAGPAVAPVGSAVTFFVRGTTGQIYTRTATAGYAAMPWFCIGAPAAAQQTPDGTTTFACQGTDRALWQATNPAGAGWNLAVSLGGVLIGGPAVSATTAETDFFAEGTDQALWESTGAGWTSLGGSVEGGAGAAALN